MATATFSFLESTHEYRDENGILVPSSTQVLKSEGLINFDGVRPSVLEYKRQIGTLTHQACEFIDKGVELDQLEIPEEVMQYVAGYLNFRNDTGFEPDLIEHGMLGECFGMRWGMRPDRRGALDGCDYVLELKCGSCSSPAWGVQLASYDLGLSGKPHLLRAAVQLGPQFPRGYKLHSYSDPADYQIFTSALAITIWKMNKNIYVSENVPERLLEAA